MSARARGAGARAERGDGRRGEAHQCAGAARRAHPFAAGVGRGRGHAAAALLPVAGAHGGAAAAGARVPCASCTRRRPPTCAPSCGGGRRWSRGGPCRRARRRSGGSLGRGARRRPRASRAPHTDARGCTPPPPPPPRPPPRRSACPRWGPSKSPGPSSSRSGPRSRSGRRTSAQPVHDGFFSISRSGSPTSSFAHCISPHHGMQTGESHAQNGEQARTSPLTTDVHIGCDVPVFAGLQICFDLQRAQLSPLLHVEREHLRWAAERAAGQRLRRARRGVGRRAQAAAARAPRARARARGRPGPCALAGRRLRRRCSAPGSLPFAPARAAGGAPQQRRAASEGVAWHAPLLAGLLAGLGRRHQQGEHSEAVHHDLPAALRRARRAKKRVSRELGVAAAALAVVFGSCVAAACLSNPGASRLTVRRRVMCRLVRAHWSPTPPRGGRSAPSAPPASGGRA